MIKASLPGLKVCKFPCLISQTHVNWRALITTSLVVAAIAPLLATGWDQALGDSHAFDHDTEEQLVGLPITIVNGGSGSNFGAKWNSAAHFSCALMDPKWRSRSGYGSRISIRATSKTFRDGVRQAIATFVVSESRRAASNRVRNVLCGFMTTRRPKTVLETHKLGKCQ